MSLGAVVGWSVGVQRAPFQRDKAKVLGKLLVETFYLVSKVTLK